MRVATFVAGGMGETGAGAGAATAAAARGVVANAGRIDGLAALLKVWGSVFVDAATGDGLEAVSRAREWVVE